MHTLGDTGGMSKEERQALDGADACHARLLNTVGQVEWTFWVLFVLLAVFVSFVITKSCASAYFEFIYMIQRRLFIIRVSRIP